MLYRKWLRARINYWEKKACENLDRLYSRETTLQENQELRAERDKIHSKLLNLNCKLKTSEKRYLARL